MRTINFKYYILLLITVSASYSCKRNQLNGNSEIKGIVAHHGRFIANARVFIKFNATELPGTDTLKFDVRVPANNAGEYVIKCYPGDYFLYGYGFDDQTGQKVAGGIHVKVRFNETVKTDVPVTE